MSFRHTLRRGIEDGRAVAWKSPANPLANPLGILGVNPSTATTDFVDDKTSNDNTVRSIARIAAFNGFDGFLLANVSPFVATDPDDLIAAINSGADVWDQVQNDIALRRVASRCSVVVVAWGGAIIEHRSLELRASEVRALLLDAKPLLHCFGKTKFGWPKHPLYLPTATPIVPFCGRAS